MNGSEKDRELIQRIAETLRNHTEPYKEGAWERFSAIRGRSPRHWVTGWPYWSAAAMLLVALSWYMLADRFEMDGVENGRGVPAQQIAQGPRTKTTDERPAETTGREDAVPSAPTPTGSRLPTVSRDRPSMRPRLSAHQGGPMRDTIENQRELPVDINTLAAVPTEQAAADSTRQLAAAAVPDVSERPAGQIQISEAVAHPAAANDYADVHAKPENSGKKWGLGVVVSPSLTSERVNMGGGIAVAYRLSDKFSLGSGVSIGELGVAQNSGGPTAMAYGFDSRQADSPVGGTGLQSTYESYNEVISVTSTVLTLDIPLNLQYNVTERFYTSVGVSFVNVLNEQRTAHFVDRLNDLTFGKENAIRDDPSRAVEAVVSTKKTGHRPLEGNGYAGFLNFSVGRKVPLSRKLMLSVEPYFKLPVGRLSREEMDFTNGGIRIVTGF
ncbi:hypothetical protein ACFOET_19055 [Parapedobacter deserti]|uniref:Outer membrane protein beta-barrel domain-containing protein n=1 Tax=Parapedobacter deserti TaxID=1912957 RepID=A0ABV7JNQ2_9SPHI